MRLGLGRRRAPEDVSEGDAATGATSTSPPAPLSPAIESFKAASESIKAREAAERASASPPPAA